jgi:hypothetical protein
MFKHQLPSLWLLLTHEVKAFLLIMKIFGALSFNFLLAITKTFRSLNTRPLPVALEKEKSA